MRCMSIMQSTPAHLWQKEQMHGLAPAPARTGLAAAPNAELAFFCSFLGAGGGARGTVACAQRHSAISQRADRAACGTAWEHQLWRALKAGHITSSTTGTGGGTAAA